jgi:hypothetical protein
METKFHNHIKQGFSTFKDLEVHSAFLIDLWAIGYK